MLLLLTTIAIAHRIEINIGRYTDFKLCVVKCMLDRVIADDSITLQTIEYINW